MTAENDFRLLLEKFGAPRVRMDVESGLYSPIRLAWARAWLDEQGAECGTDLPTPAVSETTLAEVRDVWAAAEAKETREARRLAANANDLAAEATRVAREAKSLARESRAAAKAARWIAALAITAGIAAAGAVAAFAFHVF